MSTVAKRLDGSRWNLANEVANLTHNIDGYELPFTDHIRHLVMYDEHISYIVHSAFTRSALILKCFNSRDYRVLKLAFCTYVRPLLEFSTQVWSPHYKYLIDEIESVQRFFTRKLSGLSKLSYLSRLKILDLETFLVVD